MADSKHEDVEELKQRLHHKDNLLLAEREKVRRLQRENDDLRNADKVKSASKNVRPQTFWNLIYEKIGSDPDYVKALIKNKQLSFDDVDKWGTAILGNAAFRGSYDLVQFCINLGADLNAKDKKGRTPLDNARRSGYDHIEQLLLFSQMNVSAGNDVQNTADTMLKQQGINKNMLDELKSIGDETMELLNKALMELMIRVIAQKKAFSDTLLNLCWQMVEESGQHPLKSELWQTIKTSCSQVIQHGNAIDWYWLKKCVLPSTIFFREVGDEQLDDGPPQYLYYELLKLVDEESASQLNKLQRDLDEFAKQFPQDWSSLTQWRMPHQYGQVRQDVIPNGIASQFTFDQLSESSNASFKSPQFYDYNQYLSQLVLVAQIVDDEFHESVQDMFQIDKVTKKGQIDRSQLFMKHGDDDDDDVKSNDNEKRGDGAILYTRGPVKLIERARFKAQNDYVNEPYPASACVLDFNRCSLIFNDISTMLSALQLFVNKVKYYQSGNIIGIVRNKNGFIEYLKETQYADIKLNVLIKGKHNNIIGEVQFLLKTMKTFKDRAHNLYAIQRQRETIETSLSKMLPLLLDTKKQLNIGGNMGSVNALCQCIVFHAMPTESMLQIDAKNNKCILHSICTFGHMRALKFVHDSLSGMGRQSQFIQHLFVDGNDNVNSIERAVRFARPAIIEYVFSLKAVRAKYDSNMDLLHRLIHHAFKHNKNMQIVDYLLNELNIRDKVADIVKHACTAPANRGPYQYHREKIFVQMMREGTQTALNKLISLIGGEEAFVEQHVFDVDDWNKNMVENAVRFDNLEMLKYLLSLQEVKKQYLSNDELLWRLMYHLFSSSVNADTMNYVLPTLQVDKQKMVSLMTLKCVQSSQQFGPDADQYEYYTLVARLSVSKKLRSLKKLRGIVDDDAVLAEAVFMTEKWNWNALSKAVQAKDAKVVRYLLEIEEVRQRCMDDQDELYSLLSALNENWSDQVCQTLIVDLQLTDQKLNALKAYKDIDVTKILTFSNK